jgi:ABC-2 type transport system permease protein
MNADFATVLWKEWKEIVLERTTGGPGSLLSWSTASGWGRPLMFVAVLGVFIPFRMPPARFFSPAQVLVPTFLSAFIVTTVIADSFAGERERHTLETLLASRLSDRSILFGKIAASIAYGWLIAIASVLTGTITVNVLNWHAGNAQSANEQIMMFHDAASWLILALGPPLLGGAIATAGVLISLHSATVRQAQQTLSIGIMVVFLGVLFSGTVLPPAWKIWFGNILATWSSTELVLGAAGVLLVVDLALLLAGMARFQRTKLVLD